MIVRQNDVFELRVADDAGQKIGEMLLSSKLTEAQVYDLQKLFDVAYWRGKNDRSKEIARMLGVI